MSTPTKVCKQQAVALEKRNAILAFLNKNPGARRRDILAAELLGADGFTQQMRAMIERGDVAGKPDPRGCQYFALKTSTGAALHGMQKQRIEAVLRSDYGRPPYGALPYERFHHEI